MERNLGSLIIVFLILFFQLSANAELSGPNPLISSGSDSVLSYDFTLASPPLNANNLAQGNATLSNNNSSAGGFSYSIYKCAPQPHNDTLSLDKTHLLELNGVISGIYWGVLTHHSLASSCSGMENVRGSASFSVNLASPNSYTSGATTALFKLVVADQDVVTNTVGKYFQTCDATCYLLEPEPNTPPPDIPAVQKYPTDDAEIIAANFSFNNGNFVPLLDTSADNPEPYSCTASFNGAIVSGAITIDQVQKTGTMNIPYSLLKIGGLHNADISLQCNHPFSSLSYNTWAGSYALVQRVVFQLANEIHATRIVPVQVVSNPTLNPSSGVSDLIVGKSASFKVYLKANFINPNLDGTIRVKVLDSNNNLIMVSNDIDVNSIYDVINDPKNATGEFPVFAGRFGVPGKKGVSWVVPAPAAGESSAMSFRVKVETDGAPAISARVFNNASLYANILRHVVTPPKIVFIPFESDSSISCTSKVPGEDCHSPKLSNIPILTQVGGFLSAAFPVPDNSITVGTSSVPAVSNKKLGSHDDKLISFIARKDLTQLEVIREVLGYDRAVGVATDTYIQSIYPNYSLGTYTGFEMDGMKSVITWEGSTATVLHELGHTYGAKDRYCGGDPDNPKTMPCIDPVTGAISYLTDYDGTPVKGFDAANRNAYVIPFPDINEPSNLSENRGPSFMGPAEHGLSAIATIGDIFDVTKNAFRIWVDDITYNVMLKTMVIPPLGDPEILIVSGDVSNEGVVTFGNSFSVAEGTFTQSRDDGDISISTLDAEGKIIDSVSLVSGAKFITTLTKGSTYTNPERDAGGTPFVVKFPMTSRISAIQVSKQGKVLETTTLKAQGLAAVIARIPNYAFRIPPCPLKKGKCPDEQGWKVQFIETERDTLSKQVSIIQNILDSKHPKKALLPLKLLLAELKLVTYNNYVVPNAYYISQKQAATEIEDIIDGLDGDERECARHNWKWWK